MAFYVTYPFELLNVFIKHCQQDASWRHQSGIIVEIKAMVHAEVRIWRSTRSMRFKQPEVDEVQVGDDFNRQRAILINKVLTPRFKWWRGLFTVWLGWRTASYSKNSSSGSALSLLQYSFLFRESLHGRDSILELNILTFFSSWNNGTRCGNFSHWGGSDAKLDFISRN